MGFGFQLGLMKTFLGLRGLFLLFSMQIYCTNFWFYAKIEPTIFCNLYMNPDESFLGDDWPITLTWLYNTYSEFLCHPHDCGIITKGESECYIPL